MSSGAELLRRLRQQQQQRITTRDDAKKEIDADASTSMETAKGQQLVHQIRVACTSNTRTIRSYANTKTTIEVCLGPDCSGLGGGATLLEIEELVSRNSSSDGEKAAGFQVVSGGCRDFCTMGPNVYVKSAACDKHYSKIDSPEKCRSVLDAILDQDSSATPPAIPSSETSTQKLLRKREDGIRWKAHRERAAKERRARI